MGHKVSTTLSIERFVEHDLEAVNELQYIALGANWQILEKLFTLSISGYPKSKDIYYYYDNSTV